MNHKKILVVILAVFVLLLGGASILYGKLSEAQSPDQLIVQGTQSGQADVKQNHADTDKTAGTKEATDETTAAHVLAPNFTVYDADGNEVHLSDYIGEPIVLNFWASWCGPCQMEMPDFHEKYLALGEEINFLMINMTDGSRETVKIASDFIAQNEYTFPVFFDTKSDAAMTYGAYSLPTTYFIDAEGYAIARAIGAIDAKTLQRGIDLITE